MSDNNTSDNAILQHQAATINKLVKISLLVVSLLSIAAIALFFITQISSPPKDQAKQQVVTPLTAAEIEQLRQQFKQGLTAYEVEVQPLLDDPDFSNWSHEAFELALKLKDKALTEFASANYQAAVGSLKQSKEVTVKAEAIWHQAFQKELEQAQQSFAQRKLAQAQLYVNNAAKIKSTDPGISILQQKLDVYPKVEAKLHQLAVAATENNLPKQIKLLREVLALDNSRTDIKSKLNSATYQQKKQKFQNLINQGLKQLTKGDIQAAKQSYKHAQTLFPNGTELQVLAEKVNKQESELVLNLRHQELTKHEQLDNWKKVLELAEKAQVDFPSDSMIVNWQQQAKAILQLQTEVSDYVARPHRLADANIQANAKVVIQKALPYLSASPSLAADIKKVGESINSYNKTYPILVTSDNRTFIKVLGRGSVGEVKRKTIYLPVGTYTVEGSRKGYKNKQMTLVVEASQNNSINLVCNEQI